MQQVKQSQLYQSDPTRWNALSFVKSSIIRHALTFSLFDDKYTGHTLGVVAPADKLQVQKLNNKAISWVAESRLAYTLSFLTSLNPGQYLHQYDIGHVNMCKMNGSIRIATNSR